MFDSCLGHTGYTCVNPTSKLAQGRTRIYVLQRRTRLQQRVIFNASYLEKHQSVGTEFIAGVTYFQCELDQHCLDIGTNLKSVRSTR